MGNIIFYLLLLLVFIAGVALILFRVLKHSHEPTEGEDMAKDKPKPPPK